MQFGKLTGATKLRQLIPQESCEFPASLLDEAECDVIVLSEYDDDVKKEDEEALNTSDSFEKLESEVDVQPGEDLGMASSKYLSSTENKKMIDSDTSQQVTPLQISQRGGELVNRKEFIKMKMKYDASSQDFKEVLQAVDELITFISNISSIFSQSE